MSKKELDKLRKELDRLDKELLIILRKRFRVTEKVGLCKAKGNLPIEDLKREKKLFTERLKIGKKVGLENSFNLKLFKLIIKEVKEKHRKIKKEWQKENLKNQ